MLRKAEIVAGGKSEVGQTCGDRDQFPPGRQQCGFLGLEAEQVTLAVSGQQLAVGAEEKGGVVVLPAVAFHQAAAEQIAAPAWAAWASIRAVGPSGGSASARYRSNRVKPTSQSSGSRIRSAGSRSSSIRATRATPGTCFLLWPNFQLNQRYFHEYSTFPGRRACCQSSRLRCSSGSGAFSSRPSVHSSRSRCSIRPISGPAGTPSMAN